MKKTYGDRMIVQEWMALALIDLTKEKPFEKITVTEITKHAGVSRMTFYRNYHSTQEILESYLNYLTEVNTEGVREEMQNSSNFDYTLFQFHFFKQHASFLKGMIQAGKADMILQKMNENIDKAIGIEKKYELRGYTGMLYNILLTWISEDFYTPAEKLNSIIQNVYDKDTILSINNSFINVYIKLIDESDHTSIYHFQNEEH